jgi:hypothetical protein
MAPCASSKSSTFSLEIFFEHALIREHWGIENSLYCTLDVLFGEYARRIHEINACKNMTTLRKIAWGLMIKLKTPSLSCHNIQMPALSGDDLCYLCLYMRVNDFALLAC